MSSVLSSEEISELKIKCVRYVLSQKVRRGLELIPWEQKTFKMQGEKKDMARKEVSIKMRNIKHQRIECLATDSQHLLSYYVFPDWWYGLRNNNFSGEYSTVAHLTQNHMDLSLQIPGVEDGSQSNFQSPSTQ